MEEPYQNTRAALARAYSRTEPKVVVQSPDVPAQAPAPKASADRVPVPG